MFRRRKQRNHLKGLGKQLERAGLTVKKVKGWENRGYLDFSPRATTFHHTASSKRSGNAPCIKLVTFGTQAVSGPLCNILVGRDGTIYLIAARKASHAGRGGPLRGIPRDSANRDAVGFEWENDGIGEGWPARQLEAGNVATAVTLRFLGVGVRRHFGHKEWAPDRKIDPRGIDMKRDRRRVKQIMRLLKRNKGRYVLSTSRRHRSVR
jgi:hypothetical protein